ncbi:MAG: cytidylate kinase family protein [bacterium]|nr:cytidylate kinase family protein [bacterium]
MSQTSGATTALQPVITLWETYGSGMQVLAQTLSEELGLPLTQQAFSTDELDEDARVQQESENPLLDRILGILARGSANTMQATSTGAFVQQLRDNVEAARDNTRLVTEMAESGGIIMGRSATKILAGRPNTLHVKLDGRTEDRVARASQFFGISHDKAARRQRSEDDLRTRMSIDIYDWNPLDNVNFDLVINTSTTTVEEAVAIVRAAFAARQG